MVTFLLELTYITLSWAGWYTGTTDVSKLFTGGVTLPGLDGGLTPGRTGWSAGTTDISVLLTGGVTLTSPHGLGTLVGTLHWLGETVVIRLSGRGGGGRRRWTGWWRRRRRVQSCLL